MRENAAKWMDTSYTSKQGKEGAGITFDEAIQRLFDYVLYEKDVSGDHPEEITRDEPVQPGKSSDELRCHQPIHSGQGWNQEEIEERPRLRVIRGKSVEMVG